MKFNIRAHNIELTNAIESYIEQKLGALDTYLQNKSEPFEAHIEVGKPSQHHQSGDIYEAKVTIAFANTTFRSETLKDDLYAAIDDAHDQLKHQIIKFKEKISDHHRSEE
jgi:putative sigma-54 modulation protein